MHPVYQKSSEMLHSSQWLLTTNKAEISPWDLPTEGGRATWTPWSSRAPEPT